MSIFRMFRAFESGQRLHLLEALDSVPPDEEDIFFSTDRWLSKTREIEAYAEALVTGVKNVFPELADKK